MTKSDAEIIKGPRTRFFTVECKACKKGQTVFSAAATEVKCLSCGETLAKPSGSKARLNGKILKEFN